MGALIVVLHSHCLTTCSMSLYILENSELFKRPAMYASRECSAATALKSEKDLRLLEPQDYYNNDSLGHTLIDVSA